MTSVYDVNSFYSLTCDVNDFFIKKRFRWMRKCIQRE
jgi:hypothetical protein